MRTTAVIVAAGKSERMNSNHNKIFLELKEPLLIHSLRPFEEHSMINSIIVVANDDEIEKCGEVINKYKLKKVADIVAGGETRQESSYNGITKSDSDMIIIHDAARPLVNKDAITNSIRDATIYGAAVMAVPSKDTIKLVEGGVVEKTIERNKLWMIQTPQAFKSDIIKEAHQKARQDNFTATDDSALVERLGYKVRITHGDYNNIKITTQEDLIIAKMIIEKGGKNV